jgi:hypothetical protein
VSTIGPYLWATSAHMTHSWWPLPSSPVLTSSHVSIHVLAFHRLITSLLTARYPVYYTRIYVTDMCMNIAACTGQLFSDGHRTAHRVKYWIFFISVSRMRRTRTSYTARYITYLPHTAVSWRDELDCAFSRRWPRQKNRTVYANVEKCF